MNKTGTIVLCVLAVALIAGVIIFFNKSQSNMPSAGQQTVTVTETPKPSDAMMEKESSPSATKDVSQFTVESKGLNFTPNEIRVKKGDKVSVTYKNTLGTHNFTLDEFGVKTKLLSAGQEETVTFTAEKIGTFEFYCSVANHRAMGMKGNLIVE